MINLEAFVKKYYAQIKEFGLTVKTEESAAIESMRRYPQDMLEDLGEDGIVSFLFSVIEFSDVFVTDFEGIEYADFLNQVQNISGGELTFADVEHEVSEETIEKGEGTGQVSFQCNGTKYDYSAAFYYDWLDTKFISYLNKILEEQGLEKRLILFGDLNASLITYQKRDFCQRLKERFPMLDATVA